MRTAPWRQKTPTPAQIALVSKRWSKIYPDLEEERREKMLENLTKGKAADIITRLRHGAQVNLSLTTMNNKYVNTITKGAF